MSQLKNYLPQLTATGGSGATEIAPMPYPKVGVETLTSKRHPINNKPVYIKAFEFLGNNDVAIPTGVTNGEYAAVVQFDMFAADGYTRSAANSYYSSSTSEVRCQVKTDASEILPLLPDGRADYNGHTVFVVIEYTKTADTSSSPIAALEGSSEMPYPKVDEEVLTHKRHPVNNKPIYTQAFNLTSGTDDIEVPTGITGAEKAEVVRFNLESSVWSYTGDASSNVSDASQLRCQIKNDGTSISIAILDNNINYTNKPVLVIIEYTKTADTDSSPITKVYNTQSTSLVETIPYPKVDEETLTTKRHPVSGKPVYTKAYYIADIGTTYDGTISTGLNGIDKCYTTHFEFITPTGQVITETLSQYDGDTHEFRVRTDMNGETIHYYSGDHSYYSNSSLLVEIEYTKTADTASSPIQALGVSGYSTTEKLTGETWIDGKPIYRTVIDVGTVAPSTAWTHINYSLDNPDSIVNGRIMNKTSISDGFNVGGQNIHHFHIGLTQTTYILGTIYAAWYNDAVIVLEYTKTTD